MKASPFLIALALMGACWGLTCQDAEAPESSPYTAQERIVSTVRRFYEQQPEYELPADTVRLFLDAVAELEKADSTRYARIMARAFNIRAIYAVNQGTQADVPRYLLRSVSLLSGSRDPEDLGLLGEAYNVLMIYYMMRKGDLGLAYEYNIRYLDICPLTADADYCLAVGQINAGRNRALQGDYAAAYAHFDSSMKYWSHLEVDSTNFENYSRVPLNHAAALSRHAIDLMAESRLAEAKSLYGVALGKYAESLAILDRYPAMNANLSRLYAIENASSVMMELGKLSDADTLIQLAEQMVDLIEGPSERNRSYLSMAYAHLAVGWAWKGDCEQAEQWLQRAQDTFATTFFNGQVVSHKDNYIRMLYLGARVFEQCGEADPAYLAKALKRYESLLEFMEGMRRELTSESGMEGINKDLVYRSGRAMLVALRLYEQTGKVAFAEKAFRFSERSKASGLRRSIVYREMAHEGDDSLNVLARREAQLKNRITQRESLLESLGPVAASAAVVDSLIAARQAYGAFISDLRSASDKAKTAYFLDHFHAEGPSVREIQSELPDTRTALIEYQTIGRAGVAFVILHDRFEVVRFAVGDHLIGMIQDFRENLQYEKRSYATPAYELYRQLFQRIDERMRPSGIEHLIIVPSKMLAEVVFENLLTAPPGEHASDYRKMPYLLCRFAVSYAYSLDSHHLMRGITDRRASLPVDFVGFISSPADAEDHPKWAQMNCSEVPLLSISEKTREIARFFPVGKSRIVEPARKSDYFRFAPQANILHFSMHTCFEPTHSYLNNYLQFSPDGEGTYQLKTGDILRFPIQARLAVLASCNTGQGEISRSEGLKSIARAFVMAGTPSVIATLNLVYEAPTAAIMEDFYCGLLDGHDIAQALAEAKRNYLLQADAAVAHPKYWANIIAIGDTRPVMYR
jgi:CHAT domain-containing protein